MARISTYRTKSLFRSERFRWRLRADNGEIITTSGEGYTDRAACRSMGQRVISGEFRDAESFDE